MRSQPQRPCSSLLSLARHKPIPLAAASTALSSSLPSSRAFVTPSSRPSLLLAPRPHVFVRGLSPSGSSSSVAPPRLVYELQPPNNVRVITLCNGANWLFWAGIYIGHFIAPADLIPLWWGALGLATASAFGIATHFRARRTINEIAVYQHAPNLFRFAVSDALGRPAYIDAAMQDLGPHPEPSAVHKTGSRYWTLRLSKHSGYFLLDRTGIFWDWDAMQRIMGYDVRDTTQEGEQLREGTEDSNAGKGNAGRK